MKRVLVWLTAVIAATALGGAAQAQSQDFYDYDGEFYVSGFGGIAALGREGFKGTQTPDIGVPGTLGTAVDIGVDHGNAIMYGAALGYRFPDESLGILRPRVEIEGNYIDSNIDAGTLNGVAQVFGGSQQTITATFNVYLDMMPYEGQRLVPYFGLGAGLAFTDADILYNPAGVANPTFEIDGETSSFAAFGAFGANFALSNQIEIFGEGRFLYVTEASFDHRFLANGGLSAVVDGGFAGVVAVGGVRYRF